MKVTKELAKEMKQARTMLIYRDRNGIGQLSLLFTDNIRGKSVETRKEYITDTELKIYGSYKQDQPPVNNKAMCVAHINYLDNTSPARTAIQSLKSGDEIKFHFIGRNNSQYTDQAGLNVDELRLEVSHMAPDGSRKSRDWYTLDVSVCPNNSARMIDESNSSMLSNMDLSQESRYKFENWQDYSSLFDKVLTETA